MPLSVVLSCTPVTRPNLRVISKNSNSPGAMALGATGDPDLAELVNATIAREMRLAGINWAFSPVCDLNSDPHNPIVGK